MDKHILQELDTKSIVDKIVDSITSAIIAGDFKPGEKIPSETELCESMNVGRNSVREAIKILVAYGVLVIKRGDGTYIRDEFDEKMLYPVIYGIILQKDSAAQIVDMRKIIDVGILQLSMNRITEADIALLEAGLQGLKEVLADKDVTVQAVFEADVRFHSIIVDIANNKLLKGLCRYMDQITQCSRLKVTDRLLKTNGRNGMIRKHEEIINLLKDHKHHKVIEVINSHYQYWEEELR